MSTDHFTFSDDVLSLSGTGWDVARPHLPTLPYTAVAPLEPFTPPGFSSAAALSYAAPPSVGSMLAASIVVQDDDLIAARSGGGSKPGGGGGGGGGGGPTLPTTYTSGDDATDDSAEFNVTLNFSGSWTAEQQSIVTRAADLISQIITADVMDDVDLDTGNAVDDILINISTGRIDGSGNPLFGNVLAQTQLLTYRDAGTINEFLPVTAKMTLDSTDLKNSVSGGWFDTWDDIILHEMMHAIGFAGFIFDLKDLIDSNGNFIGTNAVAAYGGTVPIETGGGNGTAGSHWAENAFSPGGTAMPDELMTGWVEYNQQTRLSDTTVGALADLGYTVADPSPNADYLGVNLLT